MYSFFPVATCFFECLLEWVPIKQAEILLYDGKAIGACSPDSIRDSLLSLVFTKKYVKLITPLPIFYWYFILAK